MKYLLIVITAIMIQGCTAVWVPLHSDPLYTQAEADLYCGQESNRTFPVKNEVAQRSVLTRVEKKCKKDDNCGESKTYQEQVPMTESYVLDVNEEHRHRYYSQCMNTKGWKQEDKFFWQ